MLDYPGAIAMMDKILRILILEDSATDAELLEYELQTADLAYTARRVMTKKEFIAALQDFSPDLIISDYDLPQYDGAAALTAARAWRPEVPFILVSGAVAEERAQEIMAGGARDYITKDHLHQLVPAIERALQAS